MSEGDGGRGEGGRDEFADPAGPADPAGSALAGEAGPEAAAVTPAARLAAYVSGGGIVVPFLTAVAAFLAGAIVLLLTGSNPISTYRAIFEGTGLTWLFPWTTGDDRVVAALNLQQTLILTTPLILVGLAVAFAFRAGLFNIGGQGQYLVGSMAAVWVGSSFADMTRLPHILLAVAAGCAAGALWAGIAGLLKAATGANEVISTIMLNYVALWLGVYLFGLRGPLQSDTQTSVPVSNDVVPAARLPVFWGDPELQGLHVGLFVALAMLLVFWVILNRSTSGYEIRAVGLNPEAGRYAGIDVGRTYVKVMALCGLFAGLAGALDVLGWQFRLATNDIQTTQIGFFGIAVALLGRNTATGTAVAALLFGALLSGSSQRNLDPSIFEPELATNLTFIIQGLIVLFVSADVLVVALLRRGRRLVPRRSRPPAAEAAE